MLYLSPDKNVQRNRKKLFLLLALTLAAYFGFRTAGNSTAAVAHFVVATDNTWFDDFQDTSGLSALENVQISTDGQLLLVGNASVGSATSKPISPTLGVWSWGRLDLTATVPISTALTVDVLDALDTLLMHNVPDGGSLAGIDAATYPVLKLRATLSSGVVGQTPHLDEWRLTWLPDNPKQLFLPIVVKSSLEPTPPSLGAAIGFIAPNDSMPLGQVVRFPSLRKNDAGWTSSFAVQNISAFATTLTLRFFREDGTVAYVADGIPLCPHGTYIASLTDFTALANGSYALAATATEVIVGMVNTTHISGKMALAYEGVSQGSQQIGISRLYKNSGGWTSRLCIHNLTVGAAQVKLDYYNQYGSLAVDRLIALAGNGFHCIDLGQDPFLPPFVGTAYITSDTDLAATVEHINSQRNRALGELGFNPAADSNTVYIPRCRKINGLPTTAILVANVGSSATDITINYHEFNGSTGYTRTYPPGMASFSCPENSSIEPPGPFSRLGSAVVTAGQSKLTALATDTNASGMDLFSYPCPSISSTVTYAPNVGSGLNNWMSILSIQNPTAVVNTVKISFYNRTGDILANFQDVQPPYGMGLYLVAEIPGLSATYEGSAIISATVPVTVLVSKQR